VPHTLTYFLLTGDSDHDFDESELYSPKCFLHTYLFALALFICASSFAAEWTIHGLTLEKGSRHPLSGVQVYVREDQSLSTTSNDKGQFDLSLPAAGQYTLIAAALGNDTPINLVVELKPDAVLPSPTFYLPASVLLDEVVVQGARSDDRVSKSIISGDELRHIAGSSGDPLVGLQALPVSLPRVPGRRCAARVPPIICIMLMTCPSAKFFTRPASVFLTPI